MKMINLFLLSLLANYLCSADKLFEVTDLKKDDHGAGYVVYPANQLWEKGELDLTGFSAKEEPKGIWFEV